MSHSIKGNGKHLTFSDRVYIEQELTQQSSFRYIAANLGKDPSTISKEVRLHCVVEPNSKDRFSRCNLCKHFGSCKDTVFICSGCITPPNPHEIIGTPVSAWNLFIISLPERIKML